MRHVALRLSVSSFVSTLAFVLHAQQPPATAASPEATPAPAAAPEPAPAAPATEPAASPPQADAWSTVIQKGVAQERANETDAERSRREERERRNLREAELGRLGLLRGRTRVFVELGLGFEYQDFDSDFDDYGYDPSGASPENPAVHSSSDISGFQVAVGAGTRFGLSTDWQLNLPASIAFTFGAEDWGSIYDGRNTEEFYSAPSRWSIALSPTARYHFAGPWYGGLGGYLGYGALSVSCEGISEAQCARSDYPDGVLFFGGLGEVGVLLGPDEAGNLMLQGYGGSNSLGGDGDVGGRLAFSWALL